MKYAKEKMPDLYSMPQEQRDKLPCSFSSISYEMIDTYEKDLARCLFLSGVPGSYAPMSEPEYPPVPTLSPSGMDTKALFSLLAEAEGFIAKDETADVVRNIHNMTIKTSGNAI